MLLTYFCRDELAQPERNLVVGLIDMFVLVVSADLLLFEAHSETRTSVSRILS